MQTVVAAVQMTSTANVEANLETTARLVKKAASLGARIIMLPESFAYLGPESGILATAEPLPSGGPILRRCTELAIEMGAELILGGFWERGGDPRRARNACVHLSADGSVRAIYRKIHLFDVQLPDGLLSRESDFIEAGDQPVVTETAWGKIGLSICYDLRFPELYRELVRRGALALAAPSAFYRDTGEAHWHALLRARAIESLAYVIAAAQVGHHYGKRFSFGHALICDPWGRILSECEDGEGLAMATLDTAEVERVRREFPCLEHRKL